MIVCIGVGGVNYPAVINHAIHQKCIKKVPGIAGKVDYDVLKVPIKNIKLWCCGI